MMGWRARLGFLVPPGNPTVEPEMMQLAPQGVSVHFSRLVASGPTGTPEGQEKRNRSYLHHIDQSTALLALVQPQVIVLAHTASSYALSPEAETHMMWLALRTARIGQTIPGHGRLLATGADGARRGHDGH